MAATPQYLNNRRAASVPVTAANTNTDGTSGTRADVFVAGANGSLVESIQIKSIVATAGSPVADMVRLWFFDGSNAYLIKEVTVPSSSAIGTANQEFDAVVAMNWPLATGQKIQASCHVVTNGYHVTAVGGDY